MYKSKVLVDFALISTQGSIQMRGLHSPQRVMKLESMPVFERMSPIFLLAGQLTH